jgi:transposase InsO family protein
VARDPAVHDTHQHHGAPESIKPGIEDERLERRFGGAFRAGAAVGIRNRHDHGSQYRSDDYQAEIAFLGMESSPSFVRQPECNGCVERFIRTLKEQLLWVRAFQNVEEPRQALAEFREPYNQRWIIQRLDYLTPAQARQQFLALGAAA